LIFTTTTTPYPRLTEIAEFFTMLNASRRSTRGNRRTPRWRSSSLAGTGLINLAPVAFPLSGVPELNKWGIREIEQPIKARPLSRRVGL
jgi:hypothetical protein